MLAFCYFSYLWLRFLLSLCQQTLKKHSERDHQRGKEGERDFEKGFVGEGERVTMRRGGRERDYERGRGKGRRETMSEGVGEERL